MSEQLSRCSVPESIRTTSTDVAQKLYTGPELLAKQYSHNSVESDIEQFFDNGSNQRRRYLTRYSNIRKLWLGILESIKTKAETIRSTWRAYRHKTTSEKAKIIISKSWKRCLLAILVHALPVLATTVIAVINMEGYFVGIDFVGITDAKLQSLALLTLQVTAKLLEITVIASLGFIVLENDVHQSLHLGTPSFWTGVGGLGSRRKRVGIALLLVSCGLLANFVGPSAALLLIPTYYNQWPAGGLRFAIPQSREQLWPSELNATHIGGSECSNPDDKYINVPALEFSNCIWYAITILGPNINNVTPYVGNFTVNDFVSNLVYWRSISWHGYETSTSAPVMWNWSGMSIANIITRKLFLNWAMAVNGTTTVDETELGNDNATWSVLSKYNRYSRRDPFGSQAELPGMLGPIARSNCLGHWSNFNESGLLPYPVMPLYRNFVHDTNANFMIPTVLVQETPVVRASWVSRPSVVEQMQNLSSSEDETEQLPSAFLAIQFPVNSSTAGVVFTCSIDARWTNFTTTFDDFDDRQIAFYGVPVTYAKLPDTTFDSQGRPSHDRFSHPVYLDSSWLEHLTPSYSVIGSNESTGATSTVQNSLSKTLDTIPQGSALNETDYFIATARLAIEAFLPILIVDGMARYNLDALLAGSLGDIQNEWIASNLSSNPAALLAGGGGTEQLTLDTLEPYSTEFLWTVTISGYAYWTDNTASILALCVLLSYVVFAVGHVCFTIHKRWNSMAWLLIPDTIALCLSSPQSDLLRNTAGGIGSRDTQRLLLKLRVTGNLNEDGETVHVLVNENQKDYRN